MSISHQKKDITRTQLLFISFAAIFGSGWLFAPLYAAQIAGPSSLLAWGLGAVISAVIGITMAEVVVLFPKTGGMLQITKATHGEFLALIVTIFNLLVFVILPAIEVRAVLQYLSTYFKILTTADNSISAYGYVFAILLLALITIVNIYGTKVTGALTKLMVFFKLVTPTLICITFLYVLGIDGATDFSRLHNVTSSSISNASNLALANNAVHSNAFFGFFNIPWSQVFQAIAVSGIIFSFNGFNQATLFAGETKNPQKAIPFAILGSLLASGLLYMLIQYVFLMSVPKASFANGWDKVTFAGDAGPFAGIATILGLGWFLTVIYADAVISPLGTAFSYASAVPRLLYGLVEGTAAQDKFLRLNSHGVSNLFIVVTLILECLAFVLLPSLKAMIALLVAAFVLCYTVAPASLLSLRKIQPNMHRPFKVRMAPLTSYLSLFFSNLMVFSCGWIALRNLICVSVILVFVYLAYHFKDQVSRNLFDNFKAKIAGSSWFLFQLCAVGVMCFLEHVYHIQFVFVFIGTALISLIALWQSQKYVPSSFNLTV